MNTKLLLAILIGISLFSLTSCRNKESNPAGPGDNAIPAGMARVSGTVLDAAGQPLPSALVHVVYEFEPAPAAPAFDPQEPMFAGLSYEGDPLTTECGGSTPIPDGVPLFLYWDRDSDGPDDTDPQLPLCNDPPECESGAPFATVNFNEMRMNGVEMGLGAGRFLADRYLTSMGNNLTPSRIYMRLPCSDGSILYTSDVLEIHDGPGDYQLTFHCTPCTGIPTVPEWHVDQAYPNPATDTVRVSYGLQQTSSPFISLERAGTGQTDTLQYITQLTGDHLLKFILGTNRPNGLYEVRVRTAGLFDAHTFVLKNVSDVPTLRGTREAAVSSTQGTFTLDTPAGTGISRRSSTGAVLSGAVLSRARIVALKTGFNAADTTLTLQSGSAYSVTLRLTPQ